MEEFDTIMMASTNIESVVNLVSLSRADPSVIVHEAAKLLKGSDEWVKCFRASRYYSPQLEAVLLTKIEPKAVITRIEEICRKFRISRPALLRAESLPIPMKQWLRAFSIGHISHRDFARLSLAVVDDDAVVKDRVLALTQCHKGALQVLEQVFGDQPDLAKLQPVVACWRGRDAIHRQKYDIVDVETEAG